MKEKRTASILFLKRESRNWGIGSNFVEEETKQKIKINYGECDHCDCGCDCFLKCFSFKKIC